MPIELIPVAPTEPALALALLLANLLALAALGRRRAWLVPPFLAGLGLRAGLALLHRLTGINPEGAADAVTMERVAHDWAAAGCGRLGPFLDPTASYVHSWIVGNVYACTERAPLVFQMINVSVAMAALALLSLAVESAAGRRRARLAAWAVALFPALLLYATVPLREAWIYLALAGAAHALVRWSRTERPAYFLLGIAWLAAGTVFHGGLLGVIAAVALYPLAPLLVRLPAARRCGRVPAREIALVVAMGFAVAAVLLAGDALRVSSLGDVRDVTTQIETIETRIAGRATGSLAYPEGLIPETAAEVAALLPARLALFLAGPFPWEARAPSLAVVAADGVIYAALALVIGLRWRDILRRRELLVLAVLGLSVAVVFAIGSSNFGTTMRHRAKLAGLLIVLAASVVPEAWLPGRRWPKGAPDPAGGRPPSPSAAARR